ncbi:MAG: ammonia-dependent NAD(+) synthetase [Actinomycetaceae bacterium]|nr:ammonia-dependent NAD(+) synthetase [Actinomycetaceae bacterium]MDY6083254.1 ammonia-dependent NAD(+) synthetase [Actinomycetaceae bacterium]
MRPLQAEIVRRLGVKPHIDPAKEVSDRVRFLVDYAQSVGARGFVLGISGGVDSTLGGRLAQLAAEQLRTQGVDARFVALRLPYRVQADEADAQQALTFIQPDESYSIDVASSVDAIVADVSSVTGRAMSDFAKGNVKARLRMVAQYTVASDRRLLVVGTDHAAEAVTGFYTKFGDGAADVTPLEDLDKRQVRSLVAYLGGPEALTQKMPTADLLDDTPGRADEDELGLRYTDIDDYLEGMDVDPAVAEKIERYFLRTRHKRTMPVAPSDSWWKE